MTHRWPHHVARTLLLVATAPWCHPQDPARPPAPAPRATPEVLQTLRQQLQTQPPGATVACGAWAAAEASARELVPDVVAALRRTLDAPRDAATPFVQLALLDALIRLEAQVPTEDLEALARIQNVRAQTLVLASRDAKRHAAALEALHADVDHLERMATDCLLAGAEPARAVALLLPEVKVRIEVSVVDPGDFESESSSFASASACGYITVPEGFPPTALYELRLGTAKDATLVADGPQPIAYRRTVRTERTFGGGSTVAPFDRAEHALRLLRYIAIRVAPQSLLSASSESTHEWQGPAAYLEELAKLQEPHRQAWHMLVAALVQGKLLTTQQVPAQAPIRVVVMDRRADQSIPLPTLPR